MDICLSPARAAASRANGAKSRGPKTAEGKARSARNALKHGLRAQKCIVVPGERVSALAAFEAALLAELAPEGVLQSVLARRVVAAAWRLARAERIEAELFAEEWVYGATLGRALIRDGNGARAIATLLRYRGSAGAELWRSLRTLKALQAEAAQAREAPAPLADADLPEQAPDSSPESPDEPEARGNPGQAHAGAAATPDAVADPTPSEAAPASDTAHGRAPGARHDAPDRPDASPGSPIGPEGRTNPGETASLDAQTPAARAA